MSGFFEEPPDPPETNVTYWRGITRHDLPPNRILKAAIDADLKCVLILGFDKEGEEYLASSLADGGDAMWLMERCKMRLLEIATIPKD